MAFSAKTGWDGKGKYPDTDDHEAAMLAEDTRTMADVPHNGPERWGAQYGITGTLPGPTESPSGSHGLSQQVHSHAGEYGEDENTGQCPSCGGPSTELGVLGKKLWMRCRDCGTEHSAG